MAAVASTTTLAILWLAAACAGPAKPEPTAPPAAVPTVAPAGPVRVLADGVELAPREVRVWSVDDANAHCQVHVVTPSNALQGDGHDVAFAVGARTWRVSSWGRDGDAAWFVIPVERADAAAIAAACGTVVCVRSPWPAQLGAQLRAAGEIAAGAEKVPLEFEMTNTGSVPLWFLDGCRGRNRLGRDNRFRFLVVHDGKAVATAEVHDFGGLGVYRRLEPSGAWTFAVDLAHWCRLEKPGRYVVRATYEAELMPGEYEPHTQQPPGQHAHWQRTRLVAAECVVTVR